MKNFEGMKMGSLLFALAAVGCADKGTDPAKPAVAKHQSMSERLSESGGYKQDADGNWVPKSDKRSSFESQGESPYFKGDYAKKEYKTGDYAKKSWWGSKEYGSKEYAGNTDATRFQTAAKQNGMMSRMNGENAKVAGPYSTNTLDRKGARESGSSEISRPSNENVEARRKVFNAPSVIDYSAQRQMSMERSKGILGR